MSTIRTVLIGEDDTEEASVVVLPLLVNNDTTRMIGTVAMIGDYAAHIQSMLESDIPIRFSGTLRDGRLIAFSLDFIPAEAFS